MLSVADAVNILNKLPPELVLTIFRNLNGLDMVHFINHNKEAYVNSLNITKDELNLWNLLEDSKNKLFKWCKILACADLNKKIYRNIYEDENHYLYYELFLNVGLSIELALKYSYLPVDKINIIFKIMKEMPGRFDIQTLYSAVSIKKELETIENYIKYAIKIDKIRNFSQNDFINYEHFKKVICHFPDSAYERLNSLREFNITFETAFILSNPTRNFSDALVEKFKQLNEEFQIRDNVLVRYLRDNKSINHIRILKTKNISSNGIISILCYTDKKSLEYLIKNNHIYELEHLTWLKIRELYNNHNAIYKEIFTKFTLKQQNNLRMKELMEDGGYNELLVSYIKENVDKIDLYSSVHQTLSITPTQYFKIYTELTDFQMSVFYEYIKNNLTFEQALRETYQVIEYN